MIVSGTILQVDHCGWSLSILALAYKSASVVGIFFFGLKALYAAIYGISIV